MLDKTVAKGRARRYLAMSKSTNSMSFVFYGVMYVFRIIQEVATRSTENVEKRVVQVLRKKKNVKTETTDTSISRLFASGIQKS